MKNIYHSTNNYSTKEDRLAVLSVYRIKLHKLLKEGFNPFEDNSELYKNRLYPKTQKKENSLENIDSAEIENIKTKDVEEPKLSFGSP